MSDTEKDRIFQLHAHHTGVLNIQSQLEVHNRQDLARAYTPGVAFLSQEIAKNPRLKRQYTLSGKLIVLITDGSAVLGLGNLGPAAGLPVIEGKALLYKDLAKVNALPLALDQVPVDEAVTTIKNISQTFAGIHLEDIAAPRCFEIETKLSQALSIPVYHDDQEGTAIVVLAGLLNAVQVVGKELTQAHIVINGVGASGYATARLLHAIGVQHLTLVDIHGVITPDDRRYNRYQRQLAQELHTAPSQKGQTLTDVIAHQDIFIGLSDQNVLQPADVQQMNKQPIIFALANPVPEIAPAKAVQAGAAVVATGSSKYPNQVNNVLVFPGLFKGLLQSSLEQVDYGLQLLVAQKLAQLTAQPDAKHIIADVFDPRVVAAVSQAVAQYAQKGK